MKRNWIRGFDRIAILLAFPMAIYGTLYVSKKFAESKGEWVYLTSEEEKVFKDCASSRGGDIFKQFGEIIVFGWKSNGVVADGKKELEEFVKQHPITEKALQRAIESGADCNGTLVNNKVFGLSYWFEDQTTLLPRTSKRYAAGMVGAITFAFATFACVGLLTRFTPKLTRWLREGFSSA